MESASFGFIPDPMDAPAAVSRPVETPLLAGSSSGTGLSTEFAADLVEGEEGRTTDEVSCDDEENNLEVILRPSSSLSNPFFNRSARPGSASSRSPYSGNPYFPEGASPSTPSIFAQSSPNGARASNSPGTTYSWNSYSPQSPIAYVYAQPCPDAEMNSFASFVYYSPSPQLGAVVVSPSTSYYSLSPQSGTASPPSFFSPQGVIMSPPTLSNSQSTPRRTQPSPITYYNQYPYDNAVQIIEPYGDDMTPGVCIQAPWQQQSSFLAEYTPPDVYETRTENSDLRSTEQLDIQDEYVYCQPAGASNVQYQATTGDFQSNGSTEGDDGEGKQVAGTDELGVAASSHDVHSIHMVGGTQQNLEVQKGNDEESINRPATIQQKRIQPAVSAAGTVAKSPAIQQCTVVPIQWPTQHGTNLRRTSMLKRFSGANPSQQHEEAERWLKDLGSAVVEHQWNFLAAFEYVHRSLEGPARAWYKGNVTSFKRHGQGWAAGWLEFWTAFEAKFVLKDEKDLQEELGKRVQKEGESIEEYATAIKELARRLGYHVDDTSVKFQLIKGIKDPGTKAKLETVLPATFAGILHKVDEYQAYAGFIAMANALSTKNSDQQIPDKDIARKPKAVPKLKKSLAGKQTTVHEESASTLAETSSPSGHDTLPEKDEPRQPTVAPSLQEASQTANVDQANPVLSNTDTMNTRTSSHQSVDHLLEKNIAAQPEAALPGQDSLTENNPPLPGKATVAVLPNEQESLTEILKLPAGEQAVLQQEQSRFPYGGKQKKVWGQKNRRYQNKQYRKKPTANDVPSQGATAEV